MKTYFYIIVFLLLKSIVFSQIDKNEDVKIHIANAYHNRGFVEVAFDFINNTNDTLKIYSLNRRDRKKDFRAKYKLFGFEEFSYEISIKTKMINTSKSKDDGDSFEIEEFSEYENPFFLRGKYSVISVLPNNKKRFSVIKEIKNYHHLLYDSVEVSAQITYNTFFIKKKVVKKMKRDILKEIKKNKKLIKKELKTPDEINKFRKKCYNPRKLTEKEKELCKLISKVRDLKYSKIKTLNHIEYLLKLSKLNVKSKVFTKNIKK